jgi:hypothetical protein
MQPKTYQDNFFEYHLQGAINSADAITPIIREYISPVSVIDIGCGIGAWLSVWKKSGVDSIAGIDGEYVDTSKLLIEKSEFKAQNLENGFMADKKYDLVTCLEVAEHIQVSLAEKFVDSLCSLGDVILFSAAIPGQGGTMHINEQYPGYWVNIFAKKGYLPIDCIRQRIWNDSKIQWWYKQNILFFVKENSLVNYPKLKDAHDKNGSVVLPFVHPELMDIKKKEVEYYESVLSSSKATLKYFLDNLFRKKKR